jgi:hypothetical protein
MNTPQTLRRRYCAQQALTLWLEQLASLIHEEELKTSPNSRQIMSWEREQARLRHECDELLEASDAKINWLLGTCAPISTVISV